MTTMATQFVEPLVRIPEIWYIVGFSVLYFVLFMFGLQLRGILLGAFFCLILSIVAFIFGIIPFWEFLLGLVLSFMAMGRIFIRSDSKEKSDEKPAENLQKPPEITGAFDESQFNKKR